MVTGTRLALRSAIWLDFELPCLRTFWHSSGRQPDQFGALDYFLCFALSDSETTGNHTHCASYLYPRRLSSIYAEDGNHCLCRYVHHFRNVSDNDFDCSSSQAQFDAVWLTWICSMDWHTESLPGYCDRTLSHTLNVLLSLSP